MRVLIELRSSSCRAILEAFRDGAFTLMTTEPLIGELIRVLRRPKFATRVSPEDRRELIDLIHRDGNVVAPQRSSVIVRNPKDRPVLDATYAADLLVTGDHDLQILRRVGTTEICSPAAFLVRLTTRR